MKGRLSHFFTNTLLLIMRKATQSFKSLPQVVSLISCLALTGCYQQDPVEEIVSGSGSELSVITRSATGNSIQYPLAIYAFDSSGECKAQKVIEDASEALTLKLSEGDYRITAIAGYGGLALPQKVKRNAIIQTVDGNCSSTPLTMGHADVLVSGSTTATIHMSLQVASVTVSLANLSEDVTDVSVSFSDEYGGISLGGQFSDARTSEIACSQQDGKWTSGRVYLLPGASSSTVVSINVKDGSGSQSYGYTYTSPLKAGVPYVFSGTFTAGSMFWGTIESKGWDEEKILDFGFGPGVSESGDSGDNNDPSEGMSVSAIPEPCSIWNGHVVALVSNATENEADLILMSLAEEESVKSKTSDNPDDAESYAKAYSEAGLASWRIPTKEEATALKSGYHGDGISPLNAALENAGGKTLTQVDSKGKNVRYLCEDALYTYSFASSSDGNSLQITKAGATVKYRLRLVKTIHVKVS